MNIKKLLHSMTLALIFCSIPFIATGIAFLVDYAVNQLNTMSIDITFMVSVLFVFLTVLFYKELE